MLSWMTCRRSSTEKPTNSRITNKSRVEILCPSGLYFHRLRLDKKTKSNGHRTEKKPTGRSNEQRASNGSSVGVGRNRNRTCARTAPATPRETDALETFSANCFMSARAAVLTEDLSSREEKNEVETSVTERAVIAGWMISAMR